MFEENEISKNANGGTEIAKRKLAEIIDPTLLENTQIICSRFRNVDQEKIRMFWCHDLPEDPESKKFQDKEFLDSFHKFVFISEWQYNRYQLVHGLPYDTKSIVIESGIEPIEWNEEDKKSDTIRLVYTSTPQRGLELLVPVFEFLSTKYENIHLDVFSSFKIYGWDDVDKQFEPLYQKIKDHPKMTYHGFVPNDDLKDHLKKCHIFAYPCTWIETSCRAMIEAMSAGLLCVHPNIGALPETSGGLNLMYQGHSDTAIHAEIFARELDYAIQRVRDRDDEYIRYMKYIKHYTDNRYHIDKIKYKWEQLLGDMNTTYPDVDSRKIIKPADMFVYRT